MPIRGIVFDKDGTLLDFNATWGPVYQATAFLVASGDAAVAEKMLAENGHDFHSGTVKSGSLLASGTNHEIAEAWQKYAPDKDVEVLAQLIDGVGTAAGAYTATPVPHLRRTIEQISERNLKIGLATSDSHGSALATLGAFDVLDKFDFVCGYDSGHGIKPGPGMVLGFCQETGCLPAEVCVVGDNAHDMDMATAANVALRVGVLTGTSNEKELAPISDHVLPSITELVNLIDQLNSGETV